MHPPSPPEKNVYTRKPPERHPMEARYRTLIRRIREEGVEKPDRTGTGTRSRFGVSVVGPTRPFPLVTSKKVKFHNVKVELLWFLQARTNVEWLHEHDVHIWDDWADEDGEVGPVYGSQWRHWDPRTEEDKYGGVQHVSNDQLKTVINRLAKSPHSRRHVVTAWNPTKLPEMNLPPCHVMFQFYARPMDAEERRALAEWAVEDDHLDRRWVTRCRDTGTDDDASLDEAGVPELRLDCQMYQRSADLFIGVPYNIASYALLTRMVARTASRQVGAPTFAPGRLKINFGDAHVYSNHGDAVDEMLANNPNRAPRISFGASRSDVDYWGVGDVRVAEYDHEGFIEAPVAV